MNTPFKATPEEAENLIWWLTHLLGGRVTIPLDGQFWEDNIPYETRLSVSNDDQGNPVLVAEKLDWTQSS